MAPGWDRIRGARTDSYRQVWCHVYELDVGRITTVGRVARALREHRVVPHRRSIYRALDVAAAAGLLRRCRKGRRIAYTRRPLPERLTVRWLTEQPNGAGLVAALNLLEALESGGYIEGGPGGYRHKK